VYGPPVGVGTVEVVVETVLVEEVPVEVVLVAVIVEELVDEIGRDPLI
jgi:hypothetical protein